MTVAIAAIILATLAASLAVLRSTSWKTLGYGALALASIFLASYALMALNDEARALSALVARFQVAPQTAQSQAPAEMLRGTAARMRAAEPPAPRQASTAENRSATAPRNTAYSTSTQRGLAKTSGSSALAQDNWEEF